MNDPSAAPRRDLTGLEWADYQILRRLGAGGMAEVYLAEQRSLGRQVALKVLHAQLASDMKYVQRFENEARAAAALVHPNIVQIYEVGHNGEIHFIAQEYVPGRNLAQLLEREGTMPPGLVLDVLRQVVSALCKSQEMQIVHRDLKPENILLTPSGEVKVADFGLARVQSADTKTLTQVGVAMGTPLYMSPEQIEGRPVDVRSDIYSLGATCYQLLSGAPPHDGETALAIAVQHLNTAPKPLEQLRPELPAALAQAVHRMLAKEPGQRPASPHELLAELRDLASQAAADGWAEGPEGWSLTERTATSRTPSKVSAELGQLMHDEAKLRLGKRRWVRLAAGLALAVFAGVLLSAATRPRPYLQAPPSAEIPRSDSPWGQIYHAKLVDDEEAWLAVEREFPDASPYLKQLANQGLVRYYLFDSQEYRRALQVLRRLDDEAPPDGPLADFVAAALCICQENLGRFDDAREANARLTPQDRDDLRRAETQLYDQLQTSLRELGE